MSEEIKTITNQLEEIAETFCNDYCKYPEIWDEEKEGLRADGQRSLCKLSAE